MINVGEYTSPMHLRVMLGGSNQQQMDGNFERGDMPILRISMHGLAVCNIMTPLWDVSLPS